MSSNPIISIIVPVYNVEHYLPKCIESILNQSFADFEVWLIDDGSSDNSGKICDEYACKDARIRVVHKQNGGVNTARKMGCKLAQGEYIALVDSDDSLPPLALSALYDKAKSLNLDVVLGSSNDICNGVERKNLNVAEGLFDKIGYVKQLLTNKCIIGPACKIIRRSCLDVEVAFSLSKKIFLNEDLFMNVCIGLQCERVGIFNDIIAYNYTADNLNSISHSKTMSECEWIYLFERIREQLKKVNSCFENCASEYYDYIYYVIGTSFYNKNRLFNDTSFIKQILSEDIYKHKGKISIYRTICKHPFLLPVYSFLRDSIRKLLKKES